MFRTRATSRQTTNLFFFANGRPCFFSFQHVQLLTALPRFLISQFPFLFYFFGGMSHSCNILFLCVYVCMRRWSISDRRRWKEEAFKLITALSSFFYFIRTHIFSAPRTIFTFSAHFTGKVRD